MVAHTQLDFAPRIQVELSGSPWRTIKGGGCWAEVIQPGLKDGSRLQVGPEMSEPMSGGAKSSCVHGDGGAQGSTNGGVAVSGYVWVMVESGSHIFQDVCRWFVWSPVLDGCH